MLEIVIVNWNANILLSECIGSLGKCSVGLVKRVIVVDNASTDDSLERVSALGTLPFECRVVNNEKNIGFAAACNQGAALVLSDYLLFLNPDSRLLENSLSVPLAFMEKAENADVGICGIQLQDELSHVARSCARFPSLGIFLSQALGVNRLPGFHHLTQRMAEWDHAETRDVDQVMGAFFLVRRSVFEALGGFDERFFVYFEEVDLARRARQAGWRSVYLAEAQAFHAGGGTSRQVKARRLFYSLRSRLLYGFKHFTSFKAWLLVGVTLLVEPLTRVVFSLIRGGLPAVSNTLKGYWMLLLDFPRILHMRNQP